jgi:hypothetical protein
VDSNAPVRPLKAVGIAAAAALAARAAAGPVQVGPAHFGSPLGIESLFAGVFLTLLFIQSDGATLSAAKPTPFRLAPLALALAFVALCFSFNLRDPYLSDDYIIVTNAAFDPHRIFALFTTPGGDGSFRPLGYLWFDLLRAIGGAVSWKWHAAALAVHLVNCGLLYGIVWTLWPEEAAAALAALLFGIHGTRPEVVTWTAGNFDLLACCFTLAAVLCLLRGRTIAGLLLVALGIMSKESAYAAPFILAGFAFAGRRQVRPALIGSLAVCALMFAWRWALFHGPGGYTDPTTGRPQVLSFHLWPAVKALCLRMWAVLLVPVNWDAGARTALAAAGILASCGALMYLAASLPRRILIGLTAVTIGATLPAYHLALIGDSLMGSRVLYLPAVGFCALCGHMSARNRPAAALLVIGMAGILAHNLRTWHQVAELADRTCAAAAAGAHPKAIHDINGIVLFANGFSECVALKR